MKVNPAYVEELKAVVRKSPYPSHMRMVLDHIEIDKAEVVIDLASCHLQPYGIVHGGVVATIIDTATFWAGFLRLPEDVGLVNVDLKLNYLQPVVDGKIRAKGSCMRHGRTLSYTEASVFDEGENLIAHGTSTLMVLPGKSLDLSLKKFLETDDKED
ncbi:PaaI family thioesterase [uncultured Desulfosarcina sp.]|uniref:PaaI family thioesterase n=1 Tax=uncultured Desulfosarcina sp. TaxID=218289 RepID=UPI0029C8BDBE|nr:PaaI family thioesterase [uncultured Desulfosarcina sp.]